MTTTQTNQANQVKDEQFLHSSLNRQIAGWSVLYTKLHNFHWYVKGPHFFKLHEKFEEFYNEAAENLDVVAERLLAIGGRPAATMSEYLSLSPVEEAAQGLSAEQMVQAIVEDYTTMVEAMVEAQEAAEALEDQVTADMLIGMQASLQKQVWMLNAFLGK
ncbi:MULTISPECIES: Dps family protein [unclassified Paenibacillus]|uniref:Dps family protein n=1 Tax=Paenibacillus provencensis TaxID=441151 RepID=A0ABW3PXM3_9BACL|nr:MULTISPECIES: Dps family protein [unclassified Paenibacillus]MCM3128439.1 DNA starvation/stationary phase protection protein [Paenibacillus sp. MER 78]SFS79130.1 starvation-inducible DNA-binding protein [Paenibacillus sp. 453mf]